MAAQQIQIAETIRAMKLAVKRRPDDAEDDEDTPSYTNRGNKLKRGAQNVREGRLDNTGGRSYRREVNHAGYTRATISTNPALFDSDGEPYSPTESDNENEHHVEAVEDNPFGEVHLDQLLKPLTAAHELIDHPSLSAAYKSKALTEMAEEALVMVRRERESLWKAKKLLRRFRGDPDWVPCETLETAGDDLLLQGQQAGHGTNILPSAVPSVTMESANGLPGQPQGGQSVKDAGIHMADGLSQQEHSQENGVQAADMAAQPMEVQTNGADQDKDQSYAVTSAEDPAAREKEAEKDQDVTMQDGDQANGDFTHEEPPNGDPNTSAAQNPAIAELRRSPDQAASESASNTGSNKIHGMTTRARARSPRASASPSPSPSDSASIPAVHPWFLAPSTSIPDRDLGLPPSEAEETRKLLLLYCQKQEQTIRSLESLYFGLQKADRLRKYVYESAKASEHLVEDGKGNLVTEMSDGEDWYDPQDWNLAGWELKDGALEKGKDEVEEPEEEGRRGVRKRRVQRVM